MINLRNTYKTAYRPNKSEVYGNAAYEQLFTLGSQFIDKGWKAGLYGKACAEDYWKGLLYHQFVILYVELFSNEYLRLISAGEDCPIDKVKESFKYSCVLDGLDCLSKKYGGNLRQLLNDAFNEIGIDVDIDCSTCCEGISTMIVGGIDPCNSFEINQCNN